MRARIASAFKYTVAASAVLGGGYLVTNPKVRMLGYNIGGVMVMVKALDLAEQEQISEDDKQQQLIWLEKAESRFTKAWEIYLQNHEEGMYSRFQMLFLRYLIVTKSQLKKYDDALYYTQFLTQVENCTELEELIKDIVVSDINIDREEDSNKKIDLHKAFKAKTEDYVLRMSKEWRSIEYLEDAATIHHFAVCRLVRSYLDLGDLENAQTELEHLLHFLEGTERCENSSDLLRLRHCIITKIILLKDASAQKEAADEMMAAMLKDQEGKSYLFTPVLQAWLFAASRYKRYGDNVKAEEYLQMVAEKELKWSRKSLKELREKCDEDSTRDAMSQLRLSLSSVAVDERGV